jgi:phosphoribosylanthranilate isomerase
MPVQVKICGITNVEDAVAAAQFGADFIGLNFYPGSPRCVSEAQARLIVQALPPSTVPVALFVNEPWERIQELTARLRINTIQVHGDDVVPCPIFGLGWIAALPARDESLLSLALTGLSEWFCPEYPGQNTFHPPMAILLDAHVPGIYGGTGRTAPWETIGRYTNNPDPLKIILAGGLTPDNVAEAIRIVRPWAVDVASGVESAPGKKDHDKMRRFIENAKAVGA